MPTSEGWWFNHTTGKNLSVPDHAAEVERSPKKFGLMPKDVSGLNSSNPEDYNLLRMLALKKGWVRVRSSRSGEVAVEFFSSPAEDVLLSTAAFLRKMGYGDFTTVYFNDLKKRKSYQAHLADYTPGKEAPSDSFSVYDNKKVDDLSARADAILERKESVRDAVVRSITTEM